MTPNKDLKQVSFKPKQILFKEGDEGCFFYIIQSGHVEVYRTGKDGSEIILGTVEAGQPLGEFALLTNNRRSASARALTEGTAIEVSESAYRKLLSELPDWSIAVLESLVSRLTRANELLLNESGRKELTIEKMDEIINQLSF